LQFINILICNCTGGSLTFTEPGYNNLYGYNVTYRSGTLQTSERQSFVDFNFLLPAGRVVEFYVYAQGRLVSVNSTAIRLQIWRPVDLTQRRWLLVWQQLVRLTNSSDGMYTVSTLKLTNFEFLYLL